MAYIPDHCPTALALAAGVDLLIHDAFLLPGEVATQASFGHPAADYAVALAHRAGARRVLLTHHKPDRTDDALDALAARFRADPSVTVAAEGALIDLYPPAAAPDHGGSAGRVGPTREPIRCGSGTRPARARASPGTRAPAAAASGSIQDRKSVV